MNNIIIIGLLSLIFGTIIGYIVRYYISKVNATSLESKAKQILNDAEKEVHTKRREVELELKDEIFKEKKSFEEEMRGRRNEVQIMEKRLLQKEENLEKKADIVEKKESIVLKLEKEVEIRESEVKVLGDEYQKRLEKISGLTKEEAKKLFLQKVENEAKHESVKIINAIEEEAKKSADKKAKEIVAYAIQKSAYDYVSDMTVSSVSLPNAEMKGRIIGREGRNIRTLENETGVDIIIDDTPEAVVISSFDPIRREVAKLSLEKLMADGRIHPTRIEEVVKKVKQELNEEMKEEGEKTIFEFGVQGVHPEIVKLLGKLKFRTSYGQNVLQHSKEVALLSGAIAAELGLNLKLATRAGLLHDIGKSLSYEVEGAHAALGAEVVKKYHENAQVVNAVASHHGDVEATSIYSTIVAAADTISAARPGARRETVENYIKRLQDLEAISNSFDGVNKSYAIQAGREVRVIVENDKVSDEQTKIVARNIANKIHDELNYPGQIKITAIRETRIVEYAK